MSFNKFQMECFKAYEGVRASGEFNMFDRRAQYAAGLEKEDFLFVMKNYAALKAQYDKEQQCDSQLTLPGFPANAK